MEKNSIPEGYTPVNGEVVGFWNADSFIYVRPEEAHVSDNTTDPKKPSILILGELLEPCQLQTSDKGKINGAPGDRVGIWYKPGMSALLELAGCSVYICPDGEKDTGKPNPMKVFKIYKKGTGGPLPVTGDWRRHSADAALPRGLAKKATTVEQNDSPPF